MDIAFTELFGGFPRAFYQAYEEHYPLQPGFEERKDLSNLYPILVHTNLFGGHYARQAKSMLQKFA
jgi:fructosamine-3-kinase